MKASLPKFDELMIPTLRALKALGGSASNEELHDWVADDLQLAPDVRDLPHGDGSMTELRYRLHWARSYLKGVGAINNSERGVWTLTDAGERVTPDDIAAIKKSVRTKRYELWKSRRASASEDEPDDALDWTEQLLSTLKAMKPDAFERLCQRVLRESGFVKVEVTGRSGDGGVDGYGVLRVNLVSFQVLFQAKRWKDSVGSGVVRDFRGAMIGRADKGLIIATGTFTADARKEATRDGAPTIDLVDGETLCRLLKDLKLGVTVRFVEEVEVEPAFFEGI
ncbi:restriction endonuclease [Methylosinus sporium]|uniref:restriction endonuclease n=1 Tax=Methylosinus sporium TaxID=428 RepID=UPI00383AEA8F